jgi:hypothetical protein
LGIKEWGMKSILLRVIFIGILGFFLSIHGSGVENPQIAAEKKPVVKKLFADLTAKVEIKLIKYPSGYILRPRYVVTNQGTAVAKNFKVVLYTSYTGAVPGGGSNLPYGALIRSPWGLTRAGPSIIIPLMTPAGIPRRGVRWVSRWSRIMTPRSGNQTRIIISPSSGGR